MSIKTLFIIYGISIVQSSIYYILNLLNAILMFFLVRLLFWRLTKVYSIQAMFCLLFFRQRNFKYGKFGTQYEQITVVSN